MADLNKPFTCSLSLSHFLDLVTICMSIFLQDQLGIDTLSTPLLIIDISILCIHSRTGNYTWSNICIIVIFARQYNYYDYYIIIMRNRWESFEISVFLTKTLAWRRCRLQDLACLCLWFHHFSISQLLYLKFNINSVWIWKLWRTLNCRAPSWLK